MALVNVGGMPLLWPGNGANQSGARATSTSDTLDAAGEYVGVVIKAREAMTISHVAFRTATVAGSPTLDIRIETVDAATGLPTGTLWATNTNVVSASLASTTWYTVALTASASIAAGEVFCVKFAYSSGTSVILATASNGGFIGQPALPYGVRNTGTPAKYSAMPIAGAIGSAADTFYRSALFLPVTYSQSGANTGTYDAHGVRFRLPFKARCAGIVRPIVSTYGEFTAGIYTDAGVEVGSSLTAFDADQKYDTNGGVMMCWFDSPATIEANTWYRAAFWPTTATSTTIYNATLGSSDYRTGAFCGADFHFTRKALGGSWDDSNANVYSVLDLMLDQIDVGGGGFAFGGMS